MTEQEKDLNEEMVNEEVQTEEIPTEDTEPVEEETEELKDADEAEESEETSEKKKGFFRKDKKDKKDEKIAELNDRIMRQMAEFDNFRKRTEKEKQQMYGIGASEVIEKLLPVVDNFERGFAAMTEEEKATAFAQGIEMVYKQLMTAFSDMGVTVIDAVGCEFNPDFHNAVMQAPSEEYESGIITQELQKGYMYKDKVIRHSMVMVAE
ncbi:nucleotide exchange factor GrpE [Frisingicoccus sp.]|uniref:nucleotide exchange factor GrpE n=1 Tax=Frisingicoccus sp. TaxID=1918627 RepID=UPI002A7F1007|nr:nucleotide exchange factor GrpE [Frisingicoccus sp.]MDY4922070.1 nucleotide exchange factor GrpE [Frisingicoccus sp.]